MTHNYGIKACALLSCRRSSEKDDCWKKTNGSNQHDLCLFMPILADTDEFSICASIVTILLILFNKV